MSGVAFHRRQLNIFIHVNFRPVRLDRIKMGQKKKEKKYHMKSSLDLCNRMRKCFTELKFIINVFFCLVHELKLNDSGAN